MSRVRGTDNRAEVSLRRAIHALGLRYRLYRRDLLGRPDLVFVRPKVVLFVDGDFWHARAFVEGGIRALRRQVRGPRRDWWVAKLLGNVSRDEAVTTGLMAAGWLVIRVWESEVLTDVDTVARRVAAAVRRRQGQARGAGGVAPSSRSR